MDVYDGKKIWIIFEFRYSNVRDILTGKWNETYWLMLSVQKKFWVTCSAFFWYLKSFIFRASLAIKMSIKLHYVCIYVCRDRGWAWKMDLINMSCLSYMLIAMKSVMREGIIIFFKVLIKYCDPDNKRVRAVIWLDVEEDIFRLLLIFQSFIKIYLLNFKTHLTMKLNDNFRFLRL